MREFESRFETIRDGLKEETARANAIARRRERRTLAIRRTLVALSLILGTTLFETRALAIADEVPPSFHGVAAMKVGGPTTQPIGHYSFCKHAPRECGAGKRDVAPPALTATRWTALKRINVHVNAAVSPRTDFEMHGLAELWSYPTDMGDCEDYVLMKRRLLMAQGFGAGDLLITVVRKPDGEGHAVLTVRTDRGDYVLDNLSDEVRSWNATPYRYLKRQASHHAGRWVDIEDGPSTLVGSVD